MASECACRGRSRYCGVRSMANTAVAARKKTQPGRNILAFLGKVKPDKRGGFTCGIEVDVM